MHLPPRGVTWDRSYMCKYHPFTIVCGSVVHVILKPKDAHHCCLFEGERNIFFVHGELLGKALQRVLTALSLFPCPSPLTDVCC